MQLSKRQLEFASSVYHGNNIFLTGKAGTGKSFIVKKIIKDLKCLKKKVVAIAPTGVAANNIGGQTIHSMFGLNPFGVMDYKSCRFMKPIKRVLMANIDTIIIDEISMVRPDILDAIHWTLIKNGCPGLDKKQVIFVGDMKQLPPVLNDNTKSILYQNYNGDNFTFSKIYPKLDIQTIELDEVLRQSNEEFISNLNIIREGKKSEYFRQFVGSDYKGVVLAPYNTTVQKYNIEGLEALEGEKLIFEAEIEGNTKADDFNLEAIVEVKHGAKIMYLANSKDAPLVNGTLGEFYVDDEDCYFIRVGSINYPLNRLEFTKKEYVYNEDLDELELKEIGKITQYPIKLAYALSIHKSQGLTFDEVTIDLSRPCFMKEQMYVALSRVKSPEGLRIIL